MGVKFDKQKTKHQLFHSSISLGTILICTLYIQTVKSWITIGKLWESFIILFILIGEISKLLLAKYYGLNENTIITYNHHQYHYQQKQQRKNQYIRKLKDYLKAIILQFLCIIFYAFICIILGAPVLHNYEQTFMLSLLLTLLTVSPTVFLLGTNGTLQIAFCEKNSDFLYKYEENCLELYKYNAFGGICGAWIGSIAVPLDWDREWQIYPIPNVIGALLGCGIANIIACSKILLNTCRTYLNNKKRL